MSVKVKTSIVIPAHNEEDNIEKLVKAIIGLYRQKIHEVVIVNDGSKDKTGEIANKLNKRYKKVRVIHRRPPNGVGLAIQDGILNVDPEATHILTMDADFIENVKDLRKFFKKISKYDGLVGSRYLKPNSLVHYPPTKKISNRIFHWFCRIFIGIKQKDLTNNFKFYKKEVFERIPLKSSDFAINAETGVYAVVYGYNIGEIPVKWIGRSSEMGVSKFDLLKVGPKYFKVFIKSFFMKHLGIVPSKNRL